jgi:hypothetical protein
MQICLLLSGLHYRENPVDNINIANYTIDFRYYIKNIKTYIFGLGNIYTYIVTNDSPLIGQLRSVYNPIELCIMEDTPNRRISKTIKGLELIKESGKIYDYICITRFDIYFMKTIILNYSKLNIFSELEVPGWYDDNFYFFPFSLLESFLSIYSTIQNSGDHCAAHKLKFTDIHYICNEHKLVQALSGFKLRYFRKMLSLNDIYTLGTEYKYNKYSIRINNTIYIKKGVGICRAGFMINITPGVYYANHIIIMNGMKTVNLGNYMHIGNENYGNHSTIKIDKETTIHFIFDMYEECNIIFNSIEFVKKTQQLFRIK